MREIYHAIARQVEEAGFFTTGMGMDALVCASKRRPDGYGLTGRSFWIAERNGKWFTSLWGAIFYVIPDASRVAGFCVACLGSTGSEFMNDRLQQQFSLKEISAEEFNAEDQN